MQLQFKIYSAEKIINFDEGSLMSGETDLYF